MKVFSKYIEKNILYPAFIDKSPDSALQNIIVIPCYDEPDILKTLNSLIECKLPQQPVEVIVVINAAKNTDPEIIKQNRNIESEIGKWKEVHKNTSISFHTILLEDISPKFSGAGFARKIGMDEAIIRFNAISNTSGFITSLDADSLVAGNYLQELEKLFLNNSKISGCSIYFEHPIEGNEFQDIVYEKITEYELYMRYYSLSLKFTGIPYYFHTVGSSFAVNSIAYCKQGGMNRKQAGEDFYFLQKIMTLGNYRYLKTTTVYPSPRPSNRVAFGTGPHIKSKLENPREEFMTYDFAAFKNLKVFFEQIDKLFGKSVDLNQLGIHESLIQFLEKNEFVKALGEINANTAALNTFKKRFWLWFDAFRILKYLNFAHERHYLKQLLKNMANDYLKYSGQEGLCTNDITGLLVNFRAIEQKAH